MRKERKRSSDDMEKFTDIIMKKTRQDVLIKLLSQDERYDERKLLDTRPLKIETDVLSSTDGSALVSLGDTQVFAGVKFALGTPFPDRPNEGVMITSSEFVPTASPTFEPGPPSEDSIELSRVVDRGIRSAESFDSKLFYVEEGKVFMMFLDLYILDHQGNLIDAAAIAGISALLNTKIPKVENGVIIHGEYEKKLDIKNIPVSTSFAKIGKYWVLDPLKAEEEASDSVMIITSIDENHVCAMQKKKGSIKKEEFLNLLDSSFKKGNDIRNDIKSQLHL